MLGRPWNLLALVGWVPFAGVVAWGEEIEPVAFDVGVRAARLLTGGAGGGAVAPLPLPPLDDVPSTASLPVPDAVERQSRRRTGALRPPTLRVAAQHVLEVAARGLRPTGVAVDRTPGRPAGILLGNVTALGVGASDGDVLTHVDGAPVTDPGEVVARVLTARAHRAPAMRGRLYRGAQAYELVVELPYPEPPGPGRSTVAAL